MDKPLRYFLQRGDEIHNFVIKFGIGINEIDIENKINEIQIYIKEIQSVSKRLADISNYINILLRQKKEILNTYTKDIKKKIKKKNDTNIIIFPNENDHAVIRMKYPNINESKMIVDNINLPIKIVDDLNQIPINNLFYIKSLNQYAINIEGVIIKGNLANIVEYKTKNSARCEYGIECKSLKNNINCNYYHDVEDFLKLNLKIPDDNYVRNYTAGSFLYCKNKKHKNYYTRHIGSKDNLLQDLQSLKKIQFREEIYNREGQLIHDLLIYMILHNKGLLERYPHWYQ